MPIREQVDRVRDLALDLMREQPGDPVWLRAVRAHLSVDVRDRVLMLAGQAFIALVPLLIVTATIMTSSDGQGVADYFIRKFELTGTAAETMHLLFTRPPDVVSGTSLLSVLIVLFSVNSFARTLRRTVDQAWGLPYIGFRGAPYGLLGVLLMVGASALVTWVGGIARGAGLGSLVIVPLLLGVAVLGWAVVLHLLLGRRVPFRALWPGAVYGAVAQTAAGWGSGLYLPALIGRNSERYGVIGVAVGLVWWLVVLTAVMVSVSVVSAELGRARAGITPSDEPPLD